MKVIKIQLIIMLAILVLLASCANSFTFDDYDTLRKSIVLVKESDALVSNIGTGWITEIDGQRVIITAQHVVDGHIGYIPSNKTGLAGLLLARTLTVTAYDGQEVDVEILSYADGDPDTDMSIDWCILSCPQALRELPFLEIAEDQAWIGEGACWAGFPDVEDAAVVGDVTISDPYGGCLRRLDIYVYMGMSGAPIYIPNKGVVGMILGGFNGSHFGVALDIPLFMNNIEDEYYRDIN